MTNVVGRVIGAPDLKSGGRQGGIIKPDKLKCQWNLVNKMVVDGKPLDRWALIDFTDAERKPRDRLDIDNFIPALMDRCRKLGMPMAEPLAVDFCGMNEFNSVKSVEKILNRIIAKAQEQVKEKLQIIVCVMVAKHDGYKYLKYVSETQLGVITQCCLVGNANKLNDQTLANIGLKINAKLGGSNMELNEPLFRGSEHVMFVGADVNHPSPMNKECPSIAAVVATMNFPAANRYAARVTPQTHRKERILTFGSMVLDLVNNYEKVNKVKPKKIVIFRDGVSDGQFDMVLNEELPDIKRAVFNNNYRPTITLVVAQKRHQTRLFPENEREGGPTGNVPPGTVVDTTIIHPSEFDFYLCSHFGGIGTSKPTHYYVLYDEHRFTSDQLQKLIYNMCYTFARCTKPVSLVPPVYYADLVAYRGRLFQEAIMSMGSPAPSVASGSSSTSFDDKFYQLHPQLQNVMFFV
jgi:eukaryotic translation initiation factor 2C